MKYGQTLLNQTHGFHDHNIPYTPLKHLIKTHTTPTPSPSLSPLLTTQLSDALSHITDFLTLKHHEYTSRVTSATRAYDRLRRSTPTEQKLASFYDKLLSLHNSLTALETFKDANRTAVRKLLKKHRRWTDANAAAKLEAKLDLTTPFAVEFGGLIRKVDRMLQLASNRLGEAASAASSTRTASTSKRGSPLRRTDSGVNVGPTWLGGGRGWNEFEHGGSDDEIGDDGEGEGNKFYVYSYGTADEDGEQRTTGWRGWFGGEQAVGDEETALLGKGEVEERRLPAWVYFVAPVASLLVLALLWVTPLVELADDPGRESGDWVDLCIAAGVTVGFVCSCVGAWTVVWGRGMDRGTRALLAVCVLAGWIVAGSVVGRVSG
ncbi:hypothetical protein BJ508DRAFT_334619 [Ascobolus immersus RN42]|uniref:SPX domain-containing protein n=1 Tax=Ascobolus immersus RN42 TaxID=1160509 RepID=A0A3N4HFF9_ASCIM|nr:hypothetical protein BJ508DRAFT_334619 [Ascobolus immersus RN42]